jgi:arginase family enzyme
MEIFDFLKPHSQDFIDAVSGLDKTKIGSKVSFYNDDLLVEDFSFTVICVNESRGNPNQQRDIDFEQIKYQFYGLEQGNWGFSFLDLGVIEKGDNISDTYYALQKITHEILKRNSIPIILGGSQDLSYSQYRAYDGFKYMVNVANLDFKFDLGDSNVPLNHESYLSHMIVDKPYNLFNYSNLGYQTFLNSQEEIKLLEKMFFEAYRLGEIANNLKQVEPAIRDADILLLDIRSIESQSLGQDNLHANGFNNREICALSRYAGLSDKVSSFGIYELQYIKSQMAEQLIAQIMWYFVEGNMYRINEKANVNNPDFLKYQVPVDNEVLVFYESKLSGRWWIEIPSNIKSVNNKLKQHTLLPCDKETYLSACDQEMPERWYKAKQKNEF